MFCDYLFVLRFYGPVNPIGSCRARSVYLTTRLLGRPVVCSGDRSKAVVPVLVLLFVALWFIL